LNNPWIKIALPGAFQKEDLGKRSAGHALSLLNLNLNLNRIGRALGASNPTSP